MKLYELPRNTKFTIDSDPEAGVFLLESIDGMYSRCYTSEGTLVHIAAYTVVTIYE